VEIPSTPNTGRMLDYWLGGSHHFPVDVEAAKLFDAIYPNSPNVFRTLRDYIGRVSRYIESQGINQFLVFGAGIPTCGNVHEVVPQAKVLYTDIDPINIELGKKILADNPNVDYAFCDATNFNTLDRTVVTQVLGSIQRLGLVFIGISAFIPDETLANILDQLYEWVPAGSFLALDFDGEAVKQYPQILEMLESTGEPLYMRNPTTISPLLGRWQLTEYDIVPVEMWQTQVSPTKEPAFMYGCVVYK
jgi:hypothetical protein